MKLLTLHRDYKDFSVDFELHHDGRVVVVGYDIDSDIALTALGDDMSPVLRDYFELSERPFNFFRDHGVLGPLFAEEVVLPVFTASTAHMTDRDDSKLRDRAEQNILEVSGILYDQLEYGYMFYLHPIKPPREIVRGTKNKDNLSDSMIEVLQMAFDLGIYRVNFDVQAQVIENIETHGWW